MAASYVFDASSVVEVILGNGDADVEVDVLFDECWLDLTRYEAANAIWESGLARDGLSDSTVDEAIEILDRLEYEMEELRTTGSTTMDVARETGLPFCDASYLAVARQDGDTVVTEDTALRKAAADLEVSAVGVQTVA